MRKRVLVAAIVVCCAVALASSVGSQNVLSQNTPPGVKTLPAGYTIPQQDVPCILPGNRLNLQCIIQNDPDFIRIRAEEAASRSSGLGCGAIRYARSIPPGRDSRRT